MSSPVDSDSMKHDLIVIETMVAELKAYLKSGILFWQMTPAVQISPPAPMLTIGGYLLRAHRLAGRQKELDQEQGAGSPRSGATLRQLSRSGAPILSNGLDESSRPGSTRGNGLSMIARPIRNLVSHTMPPRRNFGP